MVTALTELCRRSPQRTAEVRGDLDDVYTQVKRLLAEQPLAAGDETFAACVLADVCVLRGGDSDIAEAVDSIRTVRALLPDEHPGQANLEIELGGALCELAARPGGGLAELDEAAAAFTAARLLLPRDDTRQPAIAARLAMMRALRFGTYGGAPEDRDEAIALAGECLAWRGRDQTVADSCHLVIAWMMLTRQFTSAQRSATRIVPDLGRGPRRAGLGLDSIPDMDAALARLDEAQISVADAESAIAHLRDITDRTLLDDQLPGSVPAMWALATLVMIRPAGPPATWTGWQRISTVRRT